MDLIRLRFLLPLGLLLFSTFALADPISGELFFTRFSVGPGETNVNKATYSYDGASNFSLGPVVPVATTVGADGLIFEPGGNLIVGGQGDRVHKVNPNTGASTTVTAGGTQAFHVALDPSGKNVWTGGIPGQLASVPLSPFSNGTAHPLSGDDLSITSMAFDTSGKAYYTASGASGFGSFGTIDLNTFTTTRYMSNLPAAHGMAFDPFTGDLLLFGDSHISQIDIANLSVLKADFFLNGANFDQGAADGKGHILVASNTGHLLFMDYSTSGLVQSGSNFTSVKFLASNLDDVAPLSGAGSRPVPAPTTLLLITLGLMTLAVTRSRCT